MIIGKYENSGRVIQTCISELDEKWSLTTCRINHTDRQEIIIKFDGTALDVNEGQRDYIFSNQLRNAKYGYEVILAESFVLEYLDIKEKFAILFKNIETKTIKLMTLPDPFQHPIIHTGYYNSISARFSKDGLTVLIFQNHTKNFLIIDNLVLE